MVLSGAAAVQYDRQKVRRAAEHVDHGDGAVTAIADCATDPRAHGCREQHPEHTAAAVRIFAVAH